MKTGLLTIKFEHYWHCGSGQAGEGDLNLLPVTEPCGLPFVPGRTLRGRLKWAARELGWNGPDIDLLFGQEDARSLEAMGRLRLTDGTMRDAFAAECRRFTAEQRKQKKVIAALFDDVASTALKGGVALAKTLRRVRYAVPVTIYSEIELEDEDRLLSDQRTLWNGLFELVNELRAVGKGKRDGFGWCTASLTSVSRREDGASAGVAFAYDLELTPLDEIVFSASSATEGGHTTLDYIPGSSLMGAAARALFPKSRGIDERGGSGEREAALALVWAKVSFGNGVPVSANGASTFPMPLSWHRAKDQRGIRDSALQKDEIHNFAVDRAGLEQKQPVQMRDGWLDASIGIVVSVPRTQKLKTAIAVEAERYETAKDENLFGYEAIAAGARFRARLEIADGEATLSDAVRKAFDGKVVRLGRSKSTEFGRVRCVMKPAEKIHGPEITGVGFLLAESDLALVDEHGFPTLKPAPFHFGLGDGWTLCEKRSYLRFRSYSLWNAKRGGPDLERQVVSKGSVLVFTATEIGAKARPKTRVGLGQSEGLGRVLVQPVFMQSAHPTFSNPGPASAEHPAAEAAAELAGAEDLTAWAADRLEEKQFDLTAAKIARGWCAAWRSTRPKPSASQWGRLDEAARDAGTVEKLCADLGTGAEDGDDRRTIFGHGKFLKAGAAGGLPAAILRSLSEDPARGDRLVLTAFRTAVHRMAAQVRVERDGKTR